MTITDPASLVILTTNDHNGPSFRCAECKKQIKDASMANALWEFLGADNGPPIFVHKICTRSFEQRRAPKSYGAEDLDVWLYYLLMNCGMTPAKLAHAKRHGDMCMSIE